MVDGQRAVVRLMFSEVFLGHKIHISCLLPSRLAGLTQIGGDQANAEGRPSRSQDERREGCQRIETDARGHARNAKTTAEYATRSIAYLLWFEPQLLSYRLPIKVYVL